MIAVIADNQSPPEMAAGWIDGIVTMDDEPREESAVARQPRSFAGVSMICASPSGKFDIKGI
jgi:hypothetical protein